MGQVESAGAGGVMVAPPPPTLPFASSQQQQQRASTTAPQQPQPPNSPSSSTSTSTSSTAGRNGVSSTRSPAAVLAAAPQHHAPQHHSEVRSGVKRGHITAHHSMAQYDILPSEGTLGGNSSASMSSSGGGGGSLLGGRGGEGEGLHGGYEPREWLLSFSEWDADSTVRTTARTVARLIREQEWWKPGLDVLDYGCRTGLLLRSLGREAATITGLDTNRDFVDGFEDRAFEEGFKEKSTGIVLDRTPQGKETLLEKVGKKDVCMTGFTMECLSTKEQKSLLAELAQSTRGGGHIVVAMFDGVGTPSELDIRSWLKRDGIVEVSVRSFTVYQKWLKVIPWPTQALFVTGRKCIERPTSPSSPVMQHIPDLD